MTKPEKVKDAAIQRIGCPYVMGGTGRACTPDYRQARMNQYPKYADKIRDNCPRLKGSAKSCSNCKWRDPETGVGKLCYDCAQLALACMKAADIPLVSGAHSQWLKTRFSDKGDIGSLPLDKVCLVFRKDDDGKMHHVGVYLGDGTVVHARGHAYGVVRQPIDEVKFTHWGIPLGLYDNGLPTLRKGNSGEYVKLLQESLNKAGIYVETDGKFGSNTEMAVMKFQKDHKLAADGICGAKTWQALEPYIPERENPDQDEESDTDIPDEPDGEPKISREELMEAVRKIEVMQEQLDGLAYVIRGWAGIDA